MIFEPVDLIYARASLHIFQAGRPGGFELISEYNLSVQLEYIGAFTIATAVGVSIYPDVVRHETYVSVQVACVS